VERGRKRAHAGHAMGKDYYALLGVSRDFKDENELKKAYKKAAMKFHPDRPGGDEQKFKEVSEAYDVLSDKDKRAVYDAYGEEGLKQGAPPPGAAGAASGGVPGGGGFGGGAFNFKGARQGYSFEKDDAERIFKAFFGSGGQGGMGGSSSMFGGMGGGPPESDLGAEYMARFGPGGGFPRTRSSPFVGGQRPRPKRADVACTLEELYTGCKKRFKLKRTEIPRGGGAPKEVEEHLEIDVKPGWKQGTKITFEGKGDSPPGGGPPTDVQFVVTEKPHGHFRREGDDLHVPMTCSLSQALCGFTVSLKSLDGRNLRVPVEPVLKPGDSIKVGGEGMPIKGGPAKGALVIDFSIKFPTKAPDETQRAAIKSALQGL